MIYRGQSFCVSLVELTDRRGGSWVRARSQFIRPRESLVLCNIQYSLEQRIDIGNTGERGGVGGGGGGRGCL
jgi:hypothetical protein